MKTNTSFKKIEGVVSSRYIERIYPSKKQLKETLRSGKRLTVYIGIDPTAPHLHLGHSTNLLLLKKLQQLGHKIIFLIGSFTAQIGDPSGRLDARKPLSSKEVLINCKGYKKQAGKILDFSSKKNPVQLKFNDQWLAKIKLGQLMKLMNKITVSQLIRREMFQRRIKEEKEIYLHEFLYPLLQGYDSVAMKIDIEIGGNDQTFNMLVGRRLAKDYLKKEKIVIATKLLVNPKTNRKLMSKSEGNFIALDDDSVQMYGKIMALSDEVILPVFELCTELSDQKIKEMKKSLKGKKINPKIIKSQLAKEIVQIYYGEKEAQKAEKEFQRVFQEKKIPSKIKKIKIKEKELNLLNLLVKTKQISSKSEAKRLVLQKAIEINGVLKLDWQETISVKRGMIVKIGKRRFIQIEK